MMSFSLFVYRYTVYFLLIDGTPTRSIWCENVIFATGFDWPARAIGISTDIADFSEALLGWQQRVQRALSDTGLPGVVSSAPVFC
jgi:hypothetical protein